MHISDLQKEAHRIAVEHGFWDSDEYRDIHCLALRIALIHSEVSEALEAYRVSGTSDFERRLNVAEELGDTIIRIADLAEGFGLVLEKSITEKLAFNEKRPRLHGKRF